MTRRQQFAMVIARIVSTERDGAPISIADLYSAIERDHPDLVDEEVESTTGAVQWKHELRWELETAVCKGEVRRRKDLGRGMYSLR
jgi:hypothetical protein